MKITPPQSWLFLAIAIFLAMTAATGRNVGKLFVPKALKMQRLGNELVATDVLNSPVATFVLPGEITTRTKQIEVKDEVDQKERESLSTNWKTRKERQKIMPEIVIDEFRDNCIIRWLETNGNVECKGVGRKELKHKLDEMLFKAGYYTVRIGDIPSLNQEELEKLPGVDIILILNADTMTSEDVRMELIQQATKKRWDALEWKIVNLLRVERGVIRQHTRNGKTNKIGDRSSQHRDRKNAYDQNQRDDPIGMIRTIIKSLRSSSNFRGHPFILTEVLPYVIDALLGVKFDTDDIGRCGCQGNHNPCHNGKVQLKANGGGHGFSFDRQDDNLGYNQPLVVVCDMCNKPVKPDSKPVKRSKPRYVITSMVSTQVGSTVPRIKSLNNSGDPSNEHLKRWKEMYDNGSKEGLQKLREEYTAIFTEKYNKIRNGDRCCPYYTDKGDHPIEMDIGTDEKSPKFIYKNNPRQISPDRRNDLNPYYDGDNYDFCCYACQRAGREVRNEKAEKIPFTRVKRDAMVQYLKDLLSGKEKWKTMGL